MDTQSPSSLPNAEAFTPRHQLAANTWRDLKNKKPARWDNGQGRIWSGGKDMLSICVTPASVERAIRLMDAFLEKCKAAGCPVSNSQDKEGNWSSTAQVDKQRVRFHLQENVKQIDHVLTPEEKASKKKYPQLSHGPRFDYLPTGTFRLLLGSHRWGSEFRRKWNDTKRRNLEAILDKIVESVPVVAQLQQAEDDRWDRIEQENQEKERLRYEEQARQRKLKEELDILMDQANRWSQSRLIREYVGAAREMVEKRGKIEPGSEAEDWMNWALGHADRIDPLASTKPKE